jgi:CHASE2 domain-containing sensor protein
MVSQRAARIVAAWGHASKRKKRFLTNVAFGLAISILLSFVETNAAIGKARDALLTWQVAQFGSTGVGNDILWLDVDEATYLGWRAPSVTPRDRICRLVDFAVRGNARAVVVDVDLTDPSPPGPSPALQTCSAGAGAPRAGATADGELKDYLQRHSRSCRADALAARCVPIVLTRRLRTSSSFVFADGAPASVPRPSYLEQPPFSPGGDAVAWSSPNFDYDDDAIIRRWRLWEPVCEPADALPSTELLAAASFTGGGARRVESALKPMRPVCEPLGATRRERGPERKAQVTLSIGYPLELTTAAPERRFFYRIAWDARAGRPAMAAYVPAALITEADARRPFDPALAANRIVVIGGSYRDNPDFHRTPLGTMPGTLILINAIQALISDDRVRELPLWLRLAVEAVLIGIVSAMFLYAGQARAMLASSVLVIACALSFGYDFLNHGYWIDPVLPLIAIQVHELVARVEHRIHPEGES